MSIQTTLAKQPVWAIAAFVIVAAAALAWSLSRSVLSPSASIPRVAFTTDEGKSFFYGEADRPVPFDVGGKKAVIGHLYKMKDGTLVVGWLEKFSDEALPLVQRMATVKPGTAEAFMNDADSQTVAKGRRYKFPDGKEWKPLDTMTRSGVQQEAAGRLKAQNGGAPPVASDD